MSTAVATPVPPAGPPPMIEKIDDFSDKLSPMLVKELRQGLRAKTFVIVFLALQGLLTFVLLISIGAASSAETGHVVSSVIFLFFSLAVLVVQPLRGIGSLHNEIRGNTIDLMVLTRMGTWRIVLGKWVSIVSQSALLLAAIIPYLILRYFFGRMDLFAELLLLMLVFLGSAVFTAVTVGLSALPSILIRGLLPLFIAVAVALQISDVVLGGGLRRVINFCSLNEANSGWELLAGVVAMAYLGWSTLAMGAAAIAPMAENHSSVRRVISLAAVALVGVVGLAGSFNREVTAALLIVFSAPAIAIALTEPMNLMPPIVRPFVRRGFPGKLAGRVFYPGWTSGVLFAGLLILLAVAPMVFGSHSGNMRVDMMIVSALGTLLLPAVVLRIFAKKVKQALAFYLLVLAATVAIATGIFIATIEARDDSFVWYLAWIPPVQVVLSGVLELKGATDLSGVIKIGLGVVGVCYGLLLACAVKNFSALREVEDEASAKPAPQP